MSYFRDAGDVYGFIGRLLQEMAADEQLAPQFRQANTIVEFRLHNPEAQITAELMEGGQDRVEFDHSELEPEVVMEMDADVAHLFWLGQVRPTVALAHGDMQASGPVAKILRLVPLVEPVFPRYVEMLTEAGRDDLLAAVSDPPGPASGTPPPTP